MDIVGIQLNGSVQSLLVSGKVAMRIELNV